MKNKTSKNQSSQLNSNKRKKVLIFKKKYFERDKERKEKRERKEKI